MIGQIEEIHFFTLLPHFLILKLSQLRMLSAMMHNGEHIMKKHCVSAEGKEELLSSTYRINDVRT